MQSAATGSKGCLYIKMAHTDALTLAPRTHRNTQLDVAKRTFLDKHPLAKDRAQAALLKSDPFKGLSE